LDVPALLVEEGKANIAPVNNFNDRDDQVHDGGGGGMCQC
jgi:hypothetical protein